MAEVKAEEKWKALESNPDVLNEFASKLGLSDVRFFFLFIQHLINPLLLKRISNLLIFFHLMKKWNQCSQDWFQ